ncbi:MAG: type III-B CRISPR-associated protein Cas10/Cmr2 [Chloroflexota bacterium]
MSYMVVVSIGPVQSYIRQARRTQDLFLGSRMLSHLAKAGLKEINGLDGCKLVYPGYNPGNEKDSYPNRFVFTCNGDEGAIREVVKAVELAMHGEWQQVARNTERYFAKLAGSDDGAEWAEIWARQVDNWLEFYWAAVPNTDDYPDTIARANAAMAARKMFRAFEQTGEPGHKCSLTGEHEALHNGDGRLPAVREFWEDIQKNHPNMALIKDGERLCALSTIKRVAHEADDNDELTPIAMRNGQRVFDRFPSTSSVACATFRVDVLRHWDVMRNPVMHYIETLAEIFIDHDKRLYFTRSGKPNPERFPYIEAIYNDIDVQQFMSVDGDYFYEDTLELATLRKNTGRSTLEVEDVRPVLKAFKGMMQVASEAGIQRPNPYLAILSMDGDRMGAVVENFTNAEEHRQFSDSLADFADVEVKRIVEQDYPGRVIYAGGDDVLAVLPVPCALAAADTLRKSFADYMNAREFPLHASAGIAFVHRTQGLQGAIAKAKSMEKAAKKDYGRNAVAVALVRRSGEDRSMGMAWEYQGGSLNELQKIIAELRGDSNLSRNLPYDLQQMAYAMALDDDATDVDMMAARERELNRILKRRTDRTIQNDHPLTATLIALSEYGIRPEDEKPKPKPSKRWENMVGWVSLARFLSQAGECTEEVTE